MAYIFTTQAKCIAKAGVHANSTIVGTAATLEAWENDVAGRMQTLMHTDMATPTPDTATAATLSEWASSEVAMLIISYDPTGYLAREADMLMNMNDNIVKDCKNKLKDKENQKVGTYS
jgi:hypothetical protein